MARFLPPGKARFTAEIRTLVLVRLDGDIVKPFWSWFRKQPFTQQHSMMAGPDLYAALFEPEDARKIGKWVNYWERRQRAGQATEPNGPAKGDQQDG